MRRICLIVAALLAAGPLHADDTLEKSRGFRPDMVYQLNGLDSVSVYDGNLNIQLPIGPSFPVSAGLSYSFAVRYSGNIWQSRGEEKCGKKAGLWREPLDGPCFTQYVVNRENAGIGWSVSFGSLRPPSADAFPLSAATMWAYRSPDGAEHLFYDTLHEPQCSDTVTTNCDPADPSFLYTRDGSYLRMRIEGTARIIEFPNGERRRFEQKTGDPSTWRPNYIYTAHSLKAADGKPTTSFVKIDYVSHADDTAVEDWVITDSASSLRQHVVRFRRAPGSTENAFSFLVDRIELKGFNGVTSTYSFSYGATGTDGPDIIPRPSDTSGVSPATVWFLNHITYPSLETVSMKYFIPTDLSDLSGTLTKLTLPTMGSLQWAYDSYTYDSNTGGAIVRVLTRDTLDERGKIVSRLLYGGSQDLRTIDTQVPTDANSTNFRTESRIVNYFHTAIAPAAHGLPFTTEPAAAFQNPTGAAPYVSSITYDCGTDGVCAADEAEEVKYVTYEMDASSCFGDVPCSRDRNRRVKLERIVYPRDTSSRIETTYLDFDGLGHYRFSSTFDTFPSPSSRPMETDYTNYNPLRGTYETTQTSNFRDQLRYGTFTMLPTWAPWILGTFGESYKKLGSGSGATFVYSRSCFDAATGFLQRRRDFALTTGAGGADPVPSEHDLLHSFKAEPGTGFVAMEEHLGGDGQTVSVGDVCGTDFPFPAHDGTTIKRTHSYQNGALATTRAWNPGDGSTSSVPFLSVRNKIDPYTGMIRCSADPAGLQSLFDAGCTTTQAAALHTVFEYDASFRLAKVTPPGLTPTIFTYTPASLGSTYTGAKVAVDTAAAPQASVDDPTNPAVRSEYEYDPFGRLRFLRRRMPDNVWSVRETSYDGMGRTIAESEWGAGAPSSNQTRYSSFDYLGRARRVTAPDQTSITTYDFTGKRLTVRTSSVALPNGPADVKVQELMDRAGNLVRVTENFGAPSAAATNYSYGVNGKLSKVVMGVQTRELAYDGRGFLTSERHPESGTITYSYTAGGQVRERNDGRKKLTFTYDGLQRVLETQEDGVPLKTFAYDRPSSGSDYSLGKVSSATRHNWGTGLKGANGQAIPDVTVTETYTYAAKGGRLSRKVTSIATGQTFSDDYDYDYLGNLASLSYPTCSGCTSLQEPQRTVANTFTRGWLTAVGPYATMTYDPSGIVATIQHKNVNGGNGPLYRQTLQSTMARPETLSLSGHCQNLAITSQPESNKSVQPNAPADLTVTASDNATTYQWFRVNADLTYVAVAGQTGSRLTTPISAPTSFFVRVGNGTCTVDSQTVLVSVRDCDKPVVHFSLLRTADEVTAGAAARVEVDTGVNAGIFTKYEWTATNGTIVNGQGTEGVSVRASCDKTLAEMTVKVVITNTRCGASETGTTTLRVNQPSVAVSGTTTIDAGQTATVRATLTGWSGQFSVVWQDGYSQTSSGSQPIERTVTPDTTVTYSLQRASILDLCSDIAVTGSAVVTVRPLPAPARPTATALSATVVRVQWTPGTADSYRIERQSIQNNAVSTAVFATTATQFDDTVSAGQVYLYRVAAVRGSQSSPLSAPDIASTVGQAAVTAAAPRAAAIVERRPALNATRALAGGGLLPATFTDPSLSACLPANPSTCVTFNPLHITELRAALAAARQQLGLPAVVYAVTDLKSTRLLAAYVNEIRGGLK